MFINQASEKFAELLPDDIYVRQATGSSYNILGMFKERSQDDIYINQAVESSQSIRGTFAE